MGESITEQLAQRLKSLSIRGLKGIFLPIRILQESAWNCLRGTGHRVGQAILGHWDLPRLALGRVNPTVKNQPPASSQRRELSWRAARVCSGRNVSSGSPGKGDANSFPSSNQDLTVGKDSGQNPEQGCGVGRSAGLWEKDTSDESIPDLAFRGLFKTISIDRGDMTDTKQGFKHQHLVT